jgi:ankyrin repeat protein
MAQASRWAYAQGGYLEGVRLLVAHGANVSAGAREGQQTPLHLAADRGDREMTQILLEHAADVGATDEYGRSALHGAARRGHKDVAELLIAEGADVNAKDMDGATPIQFAREEGHTDIAALLKQHGAEK